jgi:putative hydrolase of the HAD superfamily
MPDIKAVIFDIDGMLINRPEIFSIRFARKNNIPMEEVLKFFKGEFQKCLVGEADLRTELNKYLKMWGIKENIEEVLKFWFEGEKEVDEKVATCAEDLSKKGVITCLATNNEKYRVDYLTKIIGIGKYFDRVISSADAGCKKPQEKFFDYVLKELEIEDPGEVMFWDNDKKNVAGAAKSGMQAYLYKNYNEFVKELRKSGL